MKTKEIKLNTDVRITLNKQGNIKTLTTPYDNNQTINKPIMYNLTNKFTTGINTIKGIYKL